MGGLFAGGTVQSTLNLSTRKRNSSPPSACSSRTMSLKPEIIEISDDEAVPPPRRRPKGKGRAQQETESPRTATAAALDELNMNEIDMEDEMNDDLELQEVTRQEYEEATYHRIAKEVPANHELVESVCHSGGAVITAGTNIELCDGDFLRVVYIIRNKELDRHSDEAYSVRGILLRRYKAMNGFFPFRTNELVAIVLMPMDDGRPHLVAGLEDRSLTTFSCVREIVFTNAAFPDFSFRDYPDQVAKWCEKKWVNGELHYILPTQSAVSEEGRLVCRYKSVKLFKKDRGQVKLHSNAFYILEPEEADLKYRRAKPQLVKQWFRASRAPETIPDQQSSGRGDNLNVTPKSSSRMSRFVVDLTIDDEIEDTATLSSKKRKTSGTSSLHPEQAGGARKDIRQAGSSGRTVSSELMITPRKRKLSLKRVERQLIGVVMDLFAGSGGASEAAKKAGLSVDVAVDIKKCAVRSHQRNHRQCRTILEDVGTFIMNAKVGQIICDIIHSSNPCRFWSPLHTTPGKDDDANYASAYMVEAAAKKFGSRLMSFEQTPGFCAIQKHEREWHMFICQFIQIGFSVEWRIINFADTSNAQRRKRLIIFAACPGQQMPEFPEATHGPPGSGLLPYVTVRQAIANIPTWATMHNPAELEASYTGGNQPIAEWDKPLQHLIATCGPLALHPSGRRRFTVRETLRLQGFPDRYEYVGDEGDGPPTRTKAMAMAGDAVPPAAAAPYFAAMKEALRKTDKEIAGWKPDILSLDD
ncbi:Putative C-5 cytosine methyltransferase, S-adenosyl-L-methionine-dependent methyltransferase [Septoria linicola]|uniref:DNA (cytosine-5-)-methyltransferase n=1 Tax=Septoria linicola TaxID=215465 RepID=A0A9Q9AGV1_9PEZI|nr:putative C-5 cytosine methyltransferase, S-adenosyl-L-methionine-dependent methyltransferase [Septoria linicola]USW47379.1 Putative C-5 cytosine methyltransferase, S-adenosyl-L-methionine-dependent methyltransferase [Septoria linicola]